MKKTFIALLAAAVCSVTCIMGLTACSKDSEPYYGKEYTLTGKSVIDWTGKNYSPDDDDKDYSQREIVEKNWDKIDWSKTTDPINKEHVEIAHSDVDGFINALAAVQENYYSDAKDLKVSVIKSDDGLQLKLALPEGLKNGYPEEITMPFAETQEKFNEIKPAELSYLTIFPKEGYSGVGIYTSEDKVLVVNFAVQQFVDKISLNIEEFTGNSEVGTNRRIFTTVEEMLSLCDSNGETLWQIRQKLDYTSKKI